MFGIVMAGIIFLLLFFEHAKYCNKSEPLLSNKAIFGILAAVCLVMAALYYLYKAGRRRIPALKPINLDRLTAWLTITLFFIQVYVAWNIFFLTGWDPSALRDFAVCLAKGSIDNVGFYQQYFSVYPNNLLLIFLQVFILKANNAVGIFTGEYTTMCLVLVNCFINSLTCWLVYKTVGLFTEKKVAFIGYSLAVLSVGISPWTVIFYSDSVGLFIPILTFYLYARPVSKPMWRYLCRFAAVLTGIVGYFIKPQCVIMLIAVVVMELAHMCQDFSPKKLVKPALMLLSCVLCFLTITRAVDGAFAKTGLVLDEEKALGMTHFFMMGQNETFNGGYSAEDVAFSKSFQTADERKSANVTKALERLENMGVEGYIKHIGKKMLMVFNDGTFAWGREGNFYLRVPENINNRMAPFLKSIFYKDGFRHPYFILFEQIVWIIILLLSGLSCLPKEDKSHSGRLGVLRLAVVGLVLFEVLFEARARYLYTFVPIFCVLATLGLKNVTDFVKAKTEWLLSKRSV